MIAKYFERIGDHATNIAEWVAIRSPDSMYKPVALWANFHYNESWKIQKKVILA